ncbi:flagellin [Paenibacillus sabinae]|uniref:Flagellin n=1 Tax=Paenibacillus sabinae T27 TaxID=1268072 RepID=X4ZQF6_9BACL|nr:flagellin [Paenibacillus sabinae]AHV99347.1 flagellin [Paenibacillus sabinae T27]
MIINHNIASLNTQRQLNTNTVNQSKNIEKLSSGLRINRAGDDAAGLAISEKMRGQIRGLDQASRNSQDAISLVQTAEGALNESHSILQRMRELAVQSASDTNTTDDRKKVQQEVDQLAKEITRISNTTEFNTQNLLAGGLNNTYQIGANAGQSIGLSINSMDAFSLGVASSQNAVGAFAAGATTLAAGSIGTEDLGRGLSAQTYNLVVTHSAAATAETADSVTGGTAISGTYTGDRNETAMFRVTAATAGEVTGVDLSLDGGTTWSSQTVTNGAGSSTVAYKGTTVTFTDGGGNAVGQSATYTLTAQKDTIQLQDASATNIGSAVTVYQDMTSVTVGDAATSRSMTIHSTSLGGLTSGTATQTVSQQSSSNATFNADGSLLTSATTVAGVDVSTQASANTAITTINNAIEKVSAERSKLGAYQNRLEHTINNLNTSSENLTASESRIRDVDMAKEMSEQTKNSILAQAAQAMLAQANQQPQGVLQLLR